MTTSTPWNRSNHHLDGIDFVLISKGLTWRRFLAQGIDGIELELRLELTLLGLKELDLKEISSSTGGSCEKLTSRCYRVKYTKNNFT